MNPELIRRYAVRSGRHLIKHLLALVLQFSFWTSPVSPWEARARSTQGLVCYCLPLRLRDGSFHVSSHTYRRPENLATIHLEYHSVGSGVQTRQTGKMPLKGAPHSTMGTSPLEVFDSVLGNYDLDAYEKYLQVSWWCLCFQPTRELRCLGLLNPGNPQIDSPCWGGG